jgi:hypothetical protein
MTVLSSGEQNTIRNSQTRLKLWLSVSRPRSLLVAQVDSITTRGETAITYDAGTGSGFGNIKAGQVLQVQTLTGIQRLRIRGITAIKRPVQLPYRQMIFYGLMIYLLKFWRSIRYYLNERNSLLIANGTKMRT